MRAAFANRILLCAFASATLLALAGCAAPRAPISIAQPTSIAPPKPDPRAQANTGGIFQTASYRPLFEDRKPRYVGDVLTININEKLNASQTANSTANRTTDLKAGIPVVKNLPLKSLQGIDLQGNTANTFTGNGATASTNLFTGTITVTVIEVLPNGNLLVSGEKQIGLRQNSETLKFSGVVNPDLVQQPGNTISSTQIADARLDYKGGGSIEEAQTQGWLGRFFNSWFPL